MPNKKKKYNARFPPARIKKIMQTDEDVGKVAAAVPVIISRALELFIESLIMKASQTTQTRHAKTLTTAHIKQTIEAEKKFDFLRDLVVNITDHQTEEEPEGNGPGSNFGETGGNKKLGRPPGSSRGPRKRKDSATSNLSSSSDNNNIRRRSKHREEEEEEEEEEDNNNDNEETDEAESEEDQEQQDEDIQDQNNQTTTEEEEATTSSCLRGEEEEEEEESPVPSSNGFPPTSAPPPGHHSLGQPSSQFKVPPALFSTTSLSRMFLPPGQTQGQQEEDDDYDT